MNALALERLDDPLAGSKPALRRSDFPCILASGVYASQPANDVGEKSSSYDELASGSLFWTQKDPIRFAGGQQNIYVYAGDDPVNGSDPSGLTVYDCFHPVGGPLGYLGIDHVYQCVVVPGQAPVCYGWGGDSEGDYFDPQNCYPQSANPDTCQDMCHAAQFQDPSRFQNPYFPLFNDCVTFANTSDDICNQLCGTQYN